MNETEKNNGNKYDLICSGAVPRPFAIAVIAVCAIPMLMTLAGADFGSAAAHFDKSTISGMPGPRVGDYMVTTLSGNFTHTILEWSAFCAAIFTAILAFAHFKIKRDIATPIIGLALFFAGCMDAFHTLAADRLINAVADNHNLLPFTWAICRLFNPIILIIGISIFLFKKSKTFTAPFGIILVAVFGFGIIAYSIIRFCAISGSLPETMFPGSVITRPYDVISLPLYIFAGVFILPRFYKKTPTLFTQAIIVSMIPNVAVQLHMAFGSSDLFDNHFNIAHFLKIVAYFTPLAGLLIDYIGTRRVESELNEKLQHETIERRLIANAFTERVMLASLNSKISVALTRVDSLHNTLQTCAEAIVNHVDALFVRVWTLDNAKTTLILRASAGLYTNVNGSYSRLPVGKSMIGLIAKERKAYITNNATEDSRIDDLEWAKREGIAAFAGFPLISEGELAGALGLFARKPLSDETIDALSSLTDMMALGMAGKRHIYDLRESEGKANAILDTAVDGIITIDEDGIIQSFNLAAERIFQFSADRVVGKNVSMLMPEPYHGNHDGYIANYKETGEKKIIGIGREVEGQRKDGSIFPLDLSVSEIKLQGKTLFTGIVRDISERRKADQELKAATLKAEDLAVKAKAADKAKSEFLASMSHEIRTPMNAILGMADLLDETALNDEQKKYVRVFKGAGESLLNIINDILDISKIEADKIVLESIVFDLNEIIDNVKEVMAYNAESKKLKINFTVNPEIPVALKGDPGRLRQILFNLCGNAIKFTAEGNISVCVENNTESKDPGSLLFSVKDSGIGIEKDKKDLIFDRFSQADTSTTRQYGGTGLGLGISKRLVELMGGRIWVESEPGKGSSFYFTLRFGPVVKVEKPAAQPVTPTLSMVFKGKRVLVADDNVTSKLTLKTMFESRGAVVRSVENGRRAIEMLNQPGTPQGKFDLVILDYLMPGMNGLEVAKKIKSISQLKSLPIICVSSSDTEGLKAKGFELGLIGVFIKPIKKDEVLKAAARAFSAMKKTSGAPLVSISQPPAAAPAEELPALDILLVEDAVDNRTLILAYLKKTPYKVDIAENGQIAVDKFISKKYDLVLMDLQMPVMDGYEAARTIRKWEKDNNKGRANILALTANALEGDAEKSKSAGCDDHVTKPIKKAKLLEVIKLYTGGKKL